MSDSEKEKSIPVDDAAVAKVQSESFSSNIRVLENLYTFVIAFSLTNAVFHLYKLLNTSATVSEVWGPIALFAAFLITIIPFYQGMSRYLNYTHVVRPLMKPNARTSPLLFDIYCFLAMTSLLFAMGQSLSSPERFFYLWSGLLVVDIAWTLIVYAIQGGTNPKWAKNNFMFLLGAWVYWFAFIFLLDAAPFLDEKRFALPYVFVLFEVFRTYRDYKINWRFYFPGEYRGRFHEQEASIEKRQSGHSIVYLAGPYSNNAPQDPSSNADAAKRLARFNAITETAKRLIEDRKRIVYSPLTMTHPIDVRMSHDPGSEYWVDFDEAFMEHCNSVAVLKLPGWDMSSGVKRELEHFRKRNVPIEYVEPAEMGISADNSDYKAAFE